MEMILTKKGNCLASWKMICRPKDQGGLGVLNLKVQNIALLIKHLHNHVNIPWVNLTWQAYYYNNETPHACTNKDSFWWRDCLSLTDLYRGMASCNVNKGNTTLLWKDVNYTIG